MNSLEKRAPPFNFSKLTQRSPCWYFKASPEIIRPAVTT